jgi:hypothetical protein
VKKMFKNWDFGNIKENRVLGIRSRDIIILECKTAMRSFYRPSCPAQGLARLFFVMGLEGDVDDGMPLLE